MNAYGYSQAVWQRFQNPAHAGILAADADDLSVFKARTAQGWTQLVVHWAGGRARFKAYGCPVTIALGEWLCEQLEIRGLSEWRTLRAADMRQALEIPDDKAHIALMGEDVVRAI